MSLLLRCAQRRIAREAACYVPDSSAFTAAPEHCLRTVDKGCSVLFSVESRCSDEYRKIKTLMGANQR